MLIGFSGYLTGYNGTFPFNKPGDSYEDYPILGMRLFCVTLGALIIPFSFVIIWNFTYSITSSILASSLLIFGKKKIMKLKKSKFKNKFCRYWNDHTVSVHIARSNIDVLHSQFNDGHGCFSILFKQSISIQMVVLAHLDWDIFSLLYQVTQVCLFIKDFCNQILFFQVSNSWDCL